MRYFVGISVATALAALSYVVCSHFANDPTKGISTGFSKGELKVIPWIVFIITLVTISKSGAKTRPKEPQLKPKSTDRFSEKSTGKNQKTHVTETIAEHGDKSDTPESAHL